MPTAALAFGYWSQNIGNAFFQVGGHALLERVFGRDGVTLIQDVPAHWTLNRKARGNPERWWDVTSKVKADYVFFQGPSLDRNVHQALDATFGALADRGVEPVLLSTGFMEYSSEEAMVARELISRHRIRHVITRDQRTFDTLGSVASFSGIDSAFFLPWALKPATLTGPPYIALAFERMVEPVATIEAIVGSSGSGGRSLRSSAVDRILNASGQKSQALAYLVQAFGPRAVRNSYGGLDVVRPVHRTNPAHVAKMFRHVNAIASDEPYTYCSVYANATLTLTDRVHACVATLAFGGRAMMLFPTGRNALLERVGVQFPMNEPISIDPAYLAEERNSELDYLRTVFGVA